MTTSIRIGRIVDGKKHNKEMINLDMSTNMAYPSQYFAVNPQKPIVRVVSKTPDIQLNTMNGALFGSAEVQPFVVVAFMHRALSKWKKVEISTEWISHRLTISTVGGCAVTDLYTAQELTVDNDISVETLEGQHCTNDNFYLYWACAASRIHASESSKAEEYKSNILTKITTRGGDEIFAGSKIPQMAMGRWNATVNDPNYLILISMIDMYLNRHPSHECAALRVATIPTRLHGFSTYQDLRHLTELLSVKLDMALRFIYSDKIGKEVDQLIKTGEEVEDRFSYTPYLVKMGCIQSSPYSSNNNQYFSCWVHAIGCMMGNSRSCNAKKLDKVSPLTIFHHAAVVAYYMKDGDDPTVQFVDESGTDKYDAREGQGEFSPTIDQTTVAGNIATDLLEREQRYTSKHSMRDPLNILALYYLLDGWPSIATTWAKTSLKGIKEPRAGTWGHYWKNLIF